MKKGRVCRADVAMYMWGPKAKVVLAADYNNALVRIAALEAKIESLRAGVELSYEPIL